MKHWSVIIVQVSNIKFIEKVNVMSEKTYNSHQNNMHDINGLSTLLFILEPFTTVD